MIAAMLNLFAMLLMLLAEAPTTSPASQPAGPTLKDDAPAEVQAAWDNREAVRSATIESIQKKLEPLLEEMKLINESKMNPKQYGDLVVEKPVHRYVFKTPAAKAERRRKQQDQIDDLRQQIRVAETAIFPLQYIESYADLEVGWIGMFGSGGMKSAGTVVQIVDANSVVVGFAQGITAKNVLVEGVSTSGMQRGRPLPKPLAIWIVGSQELPAERNRKPQTMWTAKQFYPESYVVRTATTRPAS